MTYARYFCLAILSLFLFLAPNLYAADKAVPIEVDWDGDVIALGKSTTNAMTSVLNTSLAIVSAFPPPGNHLFSWTGNRNVLQGKTVILHLTMSTSPVVKTLFASGINPNFTGNSFNGDAITAVLGDGKNNILITTMLLVDRLFYAPSVVQLFPGAVIISPYDERPDATVRAIVALSHEIYGNVQADLEMPFVNGRPSAPINHNKREMHSFQAGVDFIDRLQASPQYLTLPDKLKTDLISARAREVKTLESWRLRFCKESLRNNPF